MLNKTHAFVIISAVLLLIVKQSNGNEEVIQEMVEEFERRLSNKEYRIRHKGALDAIDQVNNEANTALQRVSRNNEKNAINEARIGYLNSIKCIAVAGDQAYNANQEAGEIFYAENAKQKVIIGNVAAKEGVRIADIASYRMLGAATASVGNYAKEQLKESIKYVTLAGQAANAGLDKSKEISIIGIECGGPAKNQSLTASNEGIEATGAVFYNNLLISVSIAFGGIDRSRPTRAAENKYSETEAAQKSPVASSFRKYINNITESAKKTISEDVSLNAVDEVEDAVIAAIDDIAEAIVKPQDVLESAKGGNNAASSEELIRKVFKQAKNDIFLAAANAIQSLGKAGYMVNRAGVRDDLEGAMSAIEVGCSVAIESLQTSLFFALSGLENGKTAMESGFTAANDALITSVFAAYARFLTAANIAFDILKS